MIESGRLRSLFQLSQAHALDRHRAAKPRAGASSAPLPCLRHAPLAPIPAAWGMQGPYLETFSTIIEYRLFCGAMVVQGAGGGLLCWVVEEERAF